MVCSSALRHNVVWEQKFKGKRLSYFLPSRWLYDSSSSSAN